VAGAGGTSAAGASSGGAPAGGMNGGGTTGVAGAATGGSAGTSVGGTAGSATGGMGGTGGSGSSTKNYTCNLVLGLDSTNEWFTNGFENQVPNDKWEMIYHHPGYVEDWESASDAVYSTAITSACAMNSTSPDRILLNLFPDSSDTSTTKLVDKDTWVTGLKNAIATLKTKYPNVKRIDLCTMMRAPGNMACDSTNAVGSAIPQYEDDAIAAVVAASSGTPQITAGPKLEATSCTIFQAGGPHFTSTAGMQAAAKIYGDYYSAEP
jgi:hypothetical protein